MSGGAESSTEQRKQFEEDAVRYGIPLELLMESVEVVPDRFEIWPENDVSLGVFMRCTTQWRYRNEGEGSRIAGLDYSAVETVMRLCRISNRNEVFDDVRAMELAVLAEVNETQT